MAKKPDIPSLDSALHASLSKTFEKTDVVIGTAEEVGLLSAVTEWLPTGIFWFDLLLSRGKGWPMGRAVEVYGNEGAGKSALCEFTVGLFVHTYKSKPHWQDHERSMDWGHFACYRVKEGQLYTPDLHTLEQGLDYIGSALDTLAARREPLEKAGLPPDPPALHIFDSIAASLPKAELEEETSEDKHMAETARAMSKGFRKYLRRISTSRSLVIFTNQVREKPGAKPGQKQTTQPGGRATKFGCSIRLEIRKLESIAGKDGQIIGHIAEVFSEKNRHAPQRMKAQIVVSYTRGIDVAWSNFLFLQTHGYIKTAGTAGYKWEPDGKEAKAFKRMGFAAWCAENAEKVQAARDAIYKKVMDSYDTAPMTDMEEEDDDEADAPAKGGGDED